MITHPFSTPIQRCHVDSLKSAVVGVFTSWNTAKTTHFKFFLFVSPFSGGLFITRNVISTSLMEETPSVQLASICSFPSFLFMPNHTETHLLRASLYVLNFQPKVNPEVKTHYAMNGQTQFCGMTTHLLLYHIDQYNYL